MRVVQETVGGYARYVARSIDAEDSIHDSRLRTWRPVSIHGRSALADVETRLESMKTPCNSHENSMEPVEPPSMSPSEREPAAGVSV